MNTTKLTDLSYLLKASDDTEFLIKMFVMFRTTVPEIKLLMDIALQKKKYETIYELAHKLKSPISILGMKITKNKIEKIESDTKNKVKYETYHDRIKDIFNDCQIAMEELLVYEKDLI